MSASGRVFEPGPTGAGTRLAASKCHLCGRIQFPRLANCPACDAASHEVWLGGPAHLVFATQILAQAPGSMVTAPYSVGVAQFDEGIRVIGLLDAEKLPAVGDTVLPVVVEPANGLTAFAFQRVSH